MQKIYIYTELIKCGNETTEEKLKFIISKYISVIQVNSFLAKKPPSEPGRAAICLDQLGAERTGKRGQQAP